MISFLRQRNYVKAISSFFLKNKSGRSIKLFHHAQLDLQNNILKIHWKTPQEETTLHPFVWLRDSCQCPRCFHSKTAQKLSETKSLNIKNVPQEIKFHGKSETVQIIWEDGHGSSYSYKWLVDRSFTPEHQILHLRNISDQISMSPPPPSHLSHIYWSSQHEIANFSYQSLISSKNRASDLLLNLRIWGICRIINAPGDLKAVNDIFYSIGYPFTTMTNIPADTTRILPKVNEILSPCSRHSQTSFHTQLPEIDFIHCIDSNENEKYHGDQFVDGFHVANLLRQNAPQYYDVLSKTLIRFWEYGTDHLKDFRMIDVKPTIMVSELHDPIEITYNPSMRDSILTMPLKGVDTFYEALKLFEQTLHNNILFYKFRKGDVIVFDNRRVLHGRNNISEKFNPKTAKEKFLSFDGATIRLQQLERKFRVSSK